METVTQAAIFQPETRRVVITKYVNLAYVGEGWYSVEFQRGGGKPRYYRRHMSNPWVAILYVMTRPLFFAGGLRVLR